MPAFSIKINGLDRLTKAVKSSPKTVYQALSGAIRNSVNIIRPIMVREAPFATGKLRGNIYARATGLTGMVGPNLSITPYAFIVHEGSRPHDIRPRFKKALYWKGALHPVKVVHHPGTKANPFIERTVDIVRNPVDKIFKLAIDQVVNKLAA